MDRGCRYRTMGRWAPRSQRVSSERCAGVIMMPWTLSVRAHEPALLRGRTVVLVGAKTRRLWLRVRPSTSCQVDRVRWRTPCVA